MMRSLTCCAEIDQKLRTKLSGAADDQKQRLLLALMEPAAVYDAKQLRKAMHGFRKKWVLIEVMTSRTNKQMADIRRAYEDMFMTELEFDISRKTNGYFQGSISLKIM
ncbi:Annexin [Ancylostoma caninum]|uniref:Annexin n=1 Tax=Ancylostoma caninum TaxID=29170 RepID=A0A368GR81_ANCCA|nr:Annexin [Ancylostoma caninum]